jgi:hypothetical protein
LGSNPCFRPAPDLRGQHLDEVLGQAERLADVTECALQRGDGRLTLNCPKDKAEPLADWLIAPLMSIATQDYVFTAQTPPKL